jgi:hypothetical protein
MATGGTGSAVAASPLPPLEMRAHLDALKHLTEAEGRDFLAPLSDTIGVHELIFDFRGPRSCGEHRTSARFATQIMRLAKA